MLVALAAHGVSGSVAVIPQGDTTEAASDALGLELLDQGLDLIWLQPETGAVGIAGGSESACGVIPGTRSATTFWIERGFFKQYQTGLQRVA